MAVGLRDLKLVIIDENSMVSDMIFTYINQRLRFIFDMNMPFGGISVLCVGDFNPLPSVSAKAIHSSNARALNLWHNFSVFKLTEIMCQRDDYDSALCLNNLAIGEMTNVYDDLIKKCILELNLTELKAVEENALILPHLDPTRITQAYRQAHPTQPVNVADASQPKPNQSSRGICLL